MARNTYEAGKWNAICDRCGLEFKNTSLKDEWTGLKVCGSCWEARHPQTLIKVAKEDPSVPWSRPEATDVDISPYLLTEDDYLPLDLLTELGAYLLTE